MYLKGKYTGLLYIITLLHDYIRLSCIIIFVYLNREESVKNGSRVHLCDIYFSQKVRYDSDW